MKSRKLGRELLLVVVVVVVVEAVFVAAVALAVPTGFLPAIPALENFCFKEDDDVEEAAPATAAVAPAPELAPTCCCGCRSLMI